MSPTTVHPWPSAVPVRELTISAETSGARLESPFTGQGTSFLGQFERWRISLKLARLNRERQQLLEAFLLSLNGQAAAFSICDLARPKPSGCIVHYGGIVANGAQTLGSNTLHLRGLPANMVDPLKPGDWLQIGQQLLKLQTHPTNPDGRYTTDSTGTMTASVFPRLRVAYTDAAPIIIDRPVGAFLATSTPEFTRTAGLQFTEPIDLAGVELVE